MAMARPTKGNGPLAEPFSEAEEKELIDFVESDEFAFESLLTPDRKVQIERMARETIANNARDLELAERATDRLKSGESRIVSSEDFWRALDD
jgi:hypothetical protein